MCNSACNIVTTFYFMLLVQVNVLVDTGSSNFAVAAYPYSEAETFFNASA